jgi:hypothetical protein
VPGVEKFNLPAKILAGFLRLSIALQNPLHFAPVVADFDLGY